jgi:hypothetical protein
VSLHFHDGLPAVWNIEERISRRWSAQFISSRRTILTGCIAPPEVTGCVGYLRRRHVASAPICPSVARIRGVAQDTGVAPDPVRRRAAIWNS